MATKASDPVQKIFLDKLKAITAAKAKNAVRIAASLDPCKQQA